MAASVFEYLGIIEARQAEINRLIRAVQLWGASEMLLKSWGASYSLEEAEPEIATTGIVSVKPLSQLPGRRAGR